MHLRSRLLERSSSLFQKNLFQKNPPFNILDQLHVSITSFVRSNNIQRCKFSWERVKNRWSIALSIIWLTRKRMDNANTWHRDARSRLTETTGVETPRAWRSRVLLQGPNDSGRERVRMKFSEAAFCEMMNSIHEKYMRIYRFFYQMEISDTRFQY